jgi:hypothetical protein
MRFAPGPSDGDKARRDLGEIEIEIEGSSKAKQR